MSASYLMIIFPTPLSIVCESHMLSRAFASTSTKSIDALLQGQPRYPYTYRRNLCPTSRYDAFHHATQVSRSKPSIYTCFTVHMHNALQDASAMERQKKSYSPSALELATCARINFCGVFKTRFVPVCVDPSHQPPCSATGSLLCGRSATGVQVQRL